MNKKLSLLLCLAVLALCLFGTVACNLHEHDYVEHAAVAATCDKAGNELYYTCSGCDKFFDKDKQEIAAVPTIGAKGHVYSEHPAVKATCTTDGSELYYTCEVCKKIFDKDKNEIDSIPTVAMGEHGYKEVAAKEPTCTEAGNELYYTCDGCNGLFDKDKKPIADIPVIPAKNHAYHKVEEKAATCEAEGNPEYYTCDNGCEQLFDKDKKQITAIPSVPANGHKYVKHDAIAATCEIDGNEAYFSCENCTKLFDVDKKEIGKIVVIPATGHAFGWKADEADNTAELRCIHGGCTESKGTIKTNLAEEDRLIVDYDSNGNLTCDLTKFGKGLFAVNVSYDNKTIVFEEAQADTMTVGIQQLFAHSVKMGKVSVTISVKMDEGPTIYVNAPITLAKLINDVDDLIAIRPAVIDGRATVTGGVVTEQDGHKVVTRYYYLLTTNLNGETRTEETSVFGEGIADTGDTSGDAKSGFVGVFDGNGHTIKNFTLNVRGFFGHVGGGTIANVTFENIVLNNADSAVLGKLMDATVTNVTIKNVETAVKLSDTSGIVAYHEIFGSKIDKLTIDLTDGKAAGHIFARQLTDGNGEWKANDFSNIVVKTNYDLKLSLTATQALTDNIGGVSVKFNPFTVAKPVADKTTFYYTGHQLTYNVAENVLYTVSGNKQTEIGSYTVTVTLKPYDGLTWEDGTTADVTFTFDIVEMTDSAAAELAQAFANKVTAVSGQLLLPRDKVAVDLLVAEYENLHDKVKALLTETKTALDELKTQADKYTQLEVVINDKIVDKIVGYDKVYVVVYNNNDTAFTLRIDESVSWHSVATADINANSAAQLELDGKIAAQGNNYLYVNGKSFKYNENTDTWKIIVYGMRDEAKAQELLTAFNAAVDAISDPLTADDADAIVAARAACDALTPYALTLVEPDRVAKLVNAEAAIGALVDQAAAKNVAAMIDALTNDSTAEEVVAASNAYDNLTVAQKAYISEAQLAALQAQVKRVEEAVVQAKANAFKAKVDALGTPKFPKDKNAVEALESEYNALEETVQAKLAETKTKLDGFVKDAAKYIELQATFGSDRIKSTFSGYNEYYLVIYNPKDAAVSFYYAGEASSWQACGQTNLPSKSYTQIAYDNRFVVAGNAYVYGDNKPINFNDTESGWICKVYGRKVESGAEVVALSVNGTTDDPTYGKVLVTNVTKGYFEAWGYMKKEQLTALAKFDNVYFCIYNPSDVDVAFFFQEDDTWKAFDRTILKAGAWTKVSLSAVFGIPDGAKGVYVDVEKSTEGLTFDGWMISDFYGTAK